MLETRKNMLASALDEIAAPVTIWTLGAGAAQAQDLQVLTQLQPLLTMRAAQAAEDAVLPHARYPRYGMSLRSDDGPRGNRFVGFPTGFALDAFVDELVAVSRGGSLSSALARETLSRLERPVAVRVLTSPG